METFIIKIKDKEKTAFTEELLRSFDFLEVQKKAGKEKKERKKKGLLLTKREKELAKAFKEIDDDITGKKKLKPLHELLNEL